MKNILMRQDGVTPIVAVLVILVVGIVGVAALRTSDAYWGRTGSRYPATDKTFRPTSGNYSNTGASVSCRPGESRVEITGTGSASCQSSNTGSTGASTTTCTINGQQVALVDGKCQYSSQGASGSPGTARCTLNGQEVPC